MEQTLFNSVAWLNVVSRLFKLTDIISIVFLVAAITVFVIAVVFLLI